MALVPDQKFSTFENGGDLQVNDIIVGLRDGLNTRFTYTGELPVGVIVPIIQGGTGANTAAGARNNLGLGSMAIQNANAVAITGGTAALTSGSVIAAPSAGSDIANKTYVDSQVGGAVASVSGTLNRITSTGGVNPVIDISASYIGQSSITTLGTIATGVWQGTVLGSTYGGTGINNGTKTINLGSPTSGYVLTSDASGNGTWQAVPAGVTSITGTLNQVFANGTSGVAQTGAVTLTLPQNIQTGAQPDFSAIRNSGTNDFIVGFQDFGGDLYMAFSSAPSGGFPRISAGGTDVDVGLEVLMQAAGIFQVSTNNDTGIQFVTGTNDHNALFSFPNVASVDTYTFQATSGTLAFLTDIPSVTPSALTKTDDSNVTITLGGSPSTALLQATSLTMGWTGQLSEIRGGTAQSTYTTGDTLYASAANTLSKLAGNITTTKQYLSQTGSGAASAAPAWATIAGTDITGAALTKTDDTNVTLTLGGTPATALLRAASLTLGWTGQLALTRGGTNASLTASNGGIVYSTASAMAILAGTATAGQMLQSGASTAPTWSTSTYPATNAVNTLLYASSANVMAALATANSAVLVTSAGGVPSLSTTLPNINIGTPTAGVLTNTTGGGGLRSFQIFTTGTAATYTKPANVTSILVEVLGGGAGGGGAAGAASSFASAGGGGAGGYARLWIAAAASSYTYTVGAGGAGGTAGANNGTSGGTTSFGASLQATGGTGGVGSPAVLVGVVQLIAGGAGGVGSNGDFNCKGAPGFVGFTINGSLTSGNGASAIYGGGGVSISNATGAGNAAGNYGSGGSGATATTVAAAGGNGTGGLIIVWEFS